MKRSHTLGVVAAATLASVAMTIPASAEMTLSYTDESPNRGARGEATEWFAQELETRTNGDIKVEMHWGGALLKAKAAAKGIGDGAADLGFVVGVYNPGLHPGFIMTDIPTEFSDIWSTTRASHELNTTNPVLQREWDDLNLHLVANLTTGPNQLVCKDHRIEKIEDLAGLKVRAISIYSKVAKDLGAIPVSMTAYDVYQGLDTGLVDCAMFYSYTIPAFKLEEIATDVTLLDWGALNGVAIAMNKDLWESLDAGTQEIITQLGSDLIDVYTEKLIASNAEAVEMVRAAPNITVTEFPAAEKAKLIAAGEPYLNEWKAKMAETEADPDALVADYLALLAKWDAMREADGYPWAR